jgi:hypothetical protein
VLPIQACPTTVVIYLGSSFIRPSREQVVTVLPSDGIYPSGAGLLDGTFSTDGPESVMTEILSAIAW